MTNKTLLAALALTASSLAVAAPADPSLQAMPPLEWTLKAPGVWSASIGREATTTYLSYAGAAPKTEALARMPEVAFPLQPSETRGLVQAERAIARIPLGPEERLYGLGLQFEGLNRRGKVYHLRMDHYRQGNERLHAPNPFYLSSRGYGVFFNTPQFIDIYAGVGNRKDSPNLPPIRDRNTDRKWQALPDSDAVEASVRAEGMEVLVFAGPTVLDALCRYNLYCGGGALPPKWGLGFWHRMRTLATAEETVAEVDEFERRDFPLDVVGLEPGWQSKAYPGTFEWSPARFADPRGFLESMTERGIQVNLWENPYVSPDAGIYPQIKPLSGSHLVWLGLVPDYTLPEARDILRDQHERDHLDLGVSGYKIDEVDGYDFWLWPDHAVFPSGTSAEEMRQTYALQLQQMLMGMFRDRNRRTYSLVRASNGGASAYPFAIYTDHYDHRGFVTALVSSSLAGVLYVPEIRSARTSEEWLRRMQSVCFSPMIQLNGWASNTKPWSFAEVEDDVREVIKLRLRLLPYIYTAFARYHFEGIPPIRPMILEPGFLNPEKVVPGAVDDAANPYGLATRKDVTDQYLFGDCLLVAPMFTGQKSRTVILPPGEWYAFESGDSVGGGKVLTVEPASDEVPLFVRNGGIIPLMPAANRVSRLPNEIPLEIRHYGSVASTTALYDDDGTTFGYEQGDHVWITLRATRGPDGKLQGEAGAPVGRYRSAYRPAEWRFMTTR